MNWHLAKRSFGTINAGVYRYLLLGNFRVKCANESSTGLKIAFMALTDAAEGSLEDQIRIPENMTYTRALDRTFDLQRPLAAPMSKSTTQLLGQSLQATKQSFSLRQDRLTETEQEIHGRASGKQIALQQNRTSEENQAESIVSASEKTLHIY